MGFFSDLKDYIFDKTVDYEGSFYVDCSAQKAAETIKSQYGGFTGRSGNLRSEKNLANSIVLEFLNVIKSSDLNKGQVKLEIYNIYFINDEMSKVILHIKGDKAKSSYNAYIRDFNKNKSGVKIVVPQTEPKIEEPKVVIEDFSSLSLKDALNKFDEKLNEFEASIDNVHFTPLSTLNVHIRTKINELDAGKRATLQGQYSTIDMYINTLKTQFSGPAAEMVASFAGTYIAQMRSAIANMIAAV